MEQRQHCPASAVARPRAEVRAGGAGRRAKRRLRQHAPPWACPVVPEVKRMTPRCPPQRRRSSAHEHGVGRGSIPRAAPRRGGRSLRSASASSSARAKPVSLGAELRGSETDVERDRRRRPPGASAKKSTTDAGWLAASTATRSPGPIPAARSAPAARGSLRVQRRPAPAPVAGDQGEPVRILDGPSPSPGSRRSPPEHLRVDAQPRQVGQDGRDRGRWRTRPGPTRAGGRWRARGPVLRREACRPGGPHPRGRRRRPWRWSPPPRRPAARPGPRTDGPGARRPPPEA